jgi:hypothetical protein
MTDFSSLDTKVIMTGSEPNDYYYKYLKIRLFSIGQVQGILYCSASISLPHRNVYVTME